MSNLIRDSRCTCDNQLDAHILRFRELRQKHPNHMPGWLESYEVGKSMEVMLARTPDLTQGRPGSPSRAKLPTLTPTLLCDTRPRCVHLPPWAFLSLGILFAARFRSTRT